MDDLEKEDLSVEHLEWLIQSRTKNQSASLKLYKLFKDHPQKIKLEKFSIPAQQLVSIAFSLWRAAFLADKTGLIGKSLKAAEKFLAKVLLDNAINYPQDRNAREWTFAYYTSNANYRFELLAARKGWPNYLAKKPDFKTPKERWDFFQTSFSKAVDFLAASLESTD